MIFVFGFYLFFFFKQKTAYEMRINDWSSDVCSSDLLDVAIDHHGRADEAHGAHADRVAEFLQLQLQGGDLGIRVAVADHAQAGRLLAEIGRASCRESVCQYV